MIERQLQAKETEGNSIARATPSRSSTTRSQPLPCSLRLRARDGPFGRDGRWPTRSAPEDFEGLFFNNMTLVLDRFVHRVRMGVADLPQDGGDSTWVVGALFTAVPYPGMMHSTEGWRERRGSSAGTASQHGRLFVPDANGETDLGRRRSLPWGIDAYGDSGWRSRQPPLS